MRCKDALKLTDAWIDNELSEKMTAVLEQHFAGCPDCSAKAEDFIHLAGILDGICSAAPSRELQDKTLHRFEREVKNHGIKEWGHSVGRLLQTTLVNSTMIWLWIGVWIVSMLGLFLTSQAPATQAKLIMALCSSRGLLPL